MKVLRETQSLCPECVQLLPARVFEEGGKIWISKTCPKHGETRELYWGDAAMYYRASGFAHDGKGITRPNVKGIKARGANCPFDCGLCSRHKSHTALANIVLTNRCDLACWYCFFFRKRNERVYEPSLAQIKKMLRTLKAQKPVAPNAVQLTGGEPTLRDDIIEVIKACKQAGFEHVQLNTNGIRLSQDLELARGVVQAGCKTIYLSFDGVTPQTNPKNHWEVPRILENCRKAGLGVVLVPTLIKGVNDHEIAAMIHFAFENIDVVRSINFQPVSIVGMVPRAQREKMRITIPDAILAIEKQTRGEIARFDFFPIPSVAAVTHLAEALSGKPQYELSTHFACGMGTYVFKDSGGGGMIPVTRFIDVPRLFELLDEASNDIKAGKPASIAKVEFVYKARKAINKERAPKAVDFQKMLFDALLSRNYRGLADFHKHSMFIGMMHFMDLYNYDVERVERCCIHYAMPDGRVVPFCAFNVIPQFYRDAVQKKYSVPRGKWERAHKRKLADDVYHRMLPESVPQSVQKKEVGHAVDLMK